MANLKPQDFVEKVTPTGTDLFVYTSPTSIWYRSTITQFLDFVKADIGAATTVKNDGVGVDNEAVLFNGASGLLIKTGSGLIFTGVNAAFSGDVGIGGSPVNKLHIFSAGNDAAKIESSSATGIVSYQLENLNQHWSLGLDGTEANAFAIKNITDASSVPLSISTANNVTFSGDIIASAAILNNVSNGTLNISGDQSFTTGANIRMRGAANANYTGQAFQFRIATDVAFTIASNLNASFGGSATATSLIKSGGVATEFLKADGSVDSNTYLTTGDAGTTYLPLAGGTLTGGLIGTTATFSGFVGVGGATTSRDLTVTSATSPFIALNGGLDNAGGILFGDLVSDASGQVRYDHSSDTMGFATNGVTDRLAIDGNGYSTFKSKVDITAVTRDFAQIAITNTTGARSWGMRVGQSGTNQTFLTFKDLTNNIDVLNMAPLTGNAVFLGSVTAKAGVFTSVDGNTLTANRTGTNGMIMQIQDEGVNKLSVHNNNGVVIADSLSVGDISTFNGRVTISGTASTEQIRIGYNSGNTTPYIGLYDGATTRMGFLQIHTINSSIDLIASGAYGVNVKSAGGGMEVATTGVATFTGDVGIGTLTTGGSSLELGALDVVQPTTVVMAANLFGKVRAASGTSGGVLFDGCSAGSNWAILQRGYIGTESLTVAAIEMRAGKNSGTSIAAITGSNLAYSFSNHTGAIKFLTISGDGTAIFDGNVGLYAESFNRTLDLKYGLSQSGRIKFHEFFGGSHFLKLDFGHNGAGNAVTLENDTGVVMSVVDGTLDTTFGGNIVGTALINSVSNGTMNISGDTTQTTGANIRLRGAANGNYAGSAIQIRIAGDNALEIGSDLSATFSSTVTATNFILSSDVRGKDIIEDLGNGYIKFKYKKGDGQLRIGTTAQHAETLYPEVVGEGSDGMKTIGYFDFLCAEVARLSNEVNELKNLN